jgi:hypothetical protein
VTARETSFAGEPGGPFEPASLEVRLHASSGSVAWRLDGLPRWLRADVKRGSTTKAGSAVRLTLRKRARRLEAGRTATLRFTNLTAPDQAPVEVRIGIRVEAN